MRVPFALSIEGMHCAACVRRVKGAVGALPGVFVDDVQLGAVHGSRDDDVDVGEVIAAIEGLGFRVPPRE